MNSNQVLNPARKDSHSATRPSRKPSVLRDEYFDAFLANVISRGIRDLSSEIHILDSIPAARGAYSSIRLGKSNDGTKIAVKLLDVDLFVSCQGNLIYEAQIWSRAMRDENVVPLLGVARIHDSVAFISPWMEGGNLREHMKANPDANPERLFADIAHGLADLHSQGIVYGNVQPSTVLVSSTGRAHLSSFLRADCRELANKSDLHWVNATQHDVLEFGRTVVKILGNGVRHNTAFLGDERSQGNSSLRKLTENFWNIVQDCLHKRPSMAQVAHRMSQIIEGSSDTPRALRDISAEVKKLNEHPIAGGGSGDLYLGEWLGSEKVALKLVRLCGSTPQDKDAARRGLMREACLWAEFKNPRILEFYGICEHGPLAVFMVSPFLQNGNIIHYLANVNPFADRNRLLSETADGLLYLHSRQPPVVHGDIKGANILITDLGSAVLADFGLSKISHDMTTKTLQGSGSPRWMAPELILAEDTAVGPLKTLKSDVYAYGHVMLEVLSSKLPFFHLKEDLHVIVQLIRGGRSPRPDGKIADEWLDDTAWAFSRSCTAINPEERPRSADVASRAALFLRRLQ